MAKENKWMNVMCEVAKRCGHGLKKECRFESRWVHVSLKKIKIVARTPDTWYDGVRGREIRVPPIGKPEDVER